MRRAALRSRFGRSALKSVHRTDLLLAQTCLTPPDMLTRCRAPLLTAQKIVNLHEAMPKLAPFLKAFLHTAKKVVR